MRASGEIEAHAESARHGSDENEYCYSPPDSMCKGLRMDFESVSDHSQIQDGDVPKVGVRFSSVAALSDMKIGSVALLSLILAGAMIACGAAHLPSTGDGGLAGSSGSGGKATGGASGDGGINGKGGAGGTGIAGTGGSSLGGNGGGGSGTGALEPAALEPAAPASAVPEPAVPAPAELGPAGPDWGALVPAESEAEGLVRAERLQRRPRELPARTTTVSVRREPA